MRPKLLIPVLVALLVVVLLGKLETVPSAITHKGSQRVVKHEYFSTKVQLGMHARIRHSFS
jgi:hypothetical protein